MRISKFFQTIDFGQVNGNEIVRKKGGVGFAHAYLERLILTESKQDDEIDIQVYKKLVALDSRLGTTAAEQLFSCVQFTQRLDFIKVSIQKEFLKIVTISSVDLYGRS